LGSEVFHLRQVPSAGSEGLGREGLEAVAEETLTETVVEGVAEIKVLILKIA